MRVLISAAEASSDAHGAELLRALRAEAPGLEAFGIGGPKLRAAGLRVVVDARELLAMGFVELLGRLPRILKALRRVAETAERERPDVAVVIDYPDFHFRLARKLGRLGIPVVYYIPPKIWVWRRGRIRELRERFARLLCILPFEEEIYRREGVPARYVGNPLVDELPLPRLAKPGGREAARAEARAALGIAEPETVLLLMPGSRPAELEQHLSPMLLAAEGVARRLRRDGRLGSSERLRALMPLPETAAASEVRARAEALLSADAVDLRISTGDASDCILASDAGLVKSGTATLEAGLLGCPHAVVYKTGATTRWIYRAIVRYRGPVGLVNLAGGWKAGDPYLAKEILLDAVTPESLEEEAYSLLTDESRRGKMLEDFARLRERVSGGGRGPSAEAAREVLAVARGPGR